MVRLKKTVFRAATVGIGLLIAQLLYLFMHRSPKEKGIRTNNGDHGLISNAQIPTEKHFDSEYEQNMVEAETFSLKMESESMESFKSDSWYKHGAKAENDESAAKVMPEDKFLKLMQQMHGGTTLQTPLDFEKILVQVEGAGKLSVDKYRKFKADEFVKMYANPAKKSDSPPMLKQFPVSITLYLYQLSTTKTFLLPAPFTNSALVNLIYTINFKC